MRQTSLYEDQHHVIDFQLNTLEIDALYSRENFHIRVMNTKIPIENNEYHIEIEIERVFTASNCNDENVVTLKTCCKK